MLCFFVLAQAEGLEIIFVCGAEIFTSQNATGNMGRVVAAVSPRRPSS